jgi:glyceraldehyde 3-phosphate dehydrogenase
VNSIRLGMMGFGRVGRQMYRLALADPRIEVVAVSDIGRPKILHHLLTKTAGSRDEIRLEGNYLVSERGRTRLMPADRPTEVPWDVFGVDMVVDATGRFRSREDLTAHLDNGVRRVILAVLPDDALDRVVLAGVNEHTASAADRIVSAGSPSTTATALVLKTMDDALDIDHVSVTSVHAYTSDQSLQDYAGPDYRRSRSGAENIIPNDTPIRHWLPRVLPQLAGKVSGYALNVPVQIGSMIDVTMSCSSLDRDTGSINELFVDAARARPDLMGVARDPIVSSDVKGCPQSLLVDLQGTMRAGSRIVKILGWHESLGHAQRILDLAALYADLDTKHAAEGA